MGPFEAKSDLTADADKEKASSSTGLSADLGNRVRGGIQAGLCRIRAAFRGPASVGCLSELAGEAKGWLQVLGGCAALGVDVQAHSRWPGWQLSIVSTRACCERLCQLPLDGMIVGGRSPAKVSGVEELGPGSEWHTEREDAAGPEGTRELVEGYRSKRRSEPEPQGPPKDEDLSAAASKCSFLAEGVKRRRLRGKQSVADHPPVVQGEGTGTVAATATSRPSASRAEEDAEIGGHKRRRKRSAERGSAS